MNNAKDLREEPVARVGVKADNDDEHDRQHGRGDPLLARRPGDAPQFEPHPANEFARILARGRCRLYFTHPLAFLELAGRTGLEPATDGFGDRNSTN